MVRPRGRGLQPRTKRAISACCQTAPMDAVRLGRQIRALRRRRGWRQIDLAGACSTSRATISRLELGHADELTVRALNAVAAALSARLTVLLSWNGEALDRLLDADHAALVERVAVGLRALGWVVVVEATFSVRGERGSVDILAYHPAALVVLVVEVKSVVPDVQATLMTLDRKSRLAMDIARSRGWDVRRVGRLLVVADGRTTRRRVREHAATFAAALPARTVAVKQWLRRPGSAPHFSGLWFLAVDRRVSARQRVRR
jgi:transcriptional regulator with XRE-family HTH domain